MSNTGRGPGSDEWRRITELFERAVALPPDAREAWLAGQADLSNQVRGTVRRMLRADGSDDGLLAAGIAPAAHLALEPEPELTPGTRVGAFDVVGELGRGGMGIVYAARDRHLDRAVALKFIRTRPGDPQEAAERVLAEAKAASALDHPNVASIYQVGQADDGRYFIAMPRYEGESLRARLARGAVPVPEVISIARQVASGLAAAHRAGIVHRDVSPANIFLTRDGTVKLLDFGIAALAGTDDETGMGAGTVPYMSPEQVRGGPTDARTDVWSLGVVVYRMLTGELPFAAETVAGTLAAIHGPAPAPTLRGRSGIPPWLARVVDRALRKSPAERYSSAEAMLQALARPPRNSRLIGAAAAGAVLAVVAAALMLRGGEPQRVSDLPVIPERPTLLLHQFRSSTASQSQAAFVAALLDDAGDRLTMLGRIRVLDWNDAGPPSPGWYQLEVSLSGDSSAPTLTAALLRTGQDAPVRRESRALQAGDARALTRWLGDLALAGSGVILTPREQASLAAGFPSNVEAYQAFLAGNQLLLERTPASVIAAMEQYRRAQRLDSSFVRAVAREAYARSLMLDWGWRVPGESRAEVLEHGMSLSARALLLDSTSADAWLARAYLLAARDPHRLSGAPEAFRRAIALDPYNAEAYHQYAQAEMVLGRFTEATNAYRRALELQPDAGLTLVSMAGLAELRGQRHTSLRLLDSAVAVAPDMAFAWAIRAHVRALAGDAEGALADATTALPLDPDYRVPALSALSVAALASGDTVAADAWLDRMLGAFSVAQAPTPDEAQLAALAALSRGRSELAITILKRARPRGALLWYLFQHPVFAELQRSAEVRRILDEADPRSQAGPSLPQSS